MKPRLLDLMCSAGGATRGYQLAGFHVTGVDIDPQPRYCGDEFVQADALDFPLDGFAAVHASPPCQQWTAYRRRGDGVGDGYPNLIPATRARLQAARVPYVIENIPPARAELRDPVMLCGSSFGLDVRRHRLFESNIPLLAPPCAHGWQTPRFPQATNRTNLRRTVEVGAWRTATLAPAAMGIDWMTTDELSEAIPPAFTLLIGEQLLAHLSRAGVRAVSPGPPTSSSPTAPGGAGAPGGADPAPALDASEVALAEESGTARPAGYVPGEDPAPPRTYRPAFVDNDARPVPTTRKDVPVQEGVL